MKINNIMKLLSCAAIFTAGAANAHMHLNDADNGNIQLAQNHYNHSGDYYYSDDAEMMEGHVARGQFTTNVYDREPQDDIDSASASMDENVTYFTELKNFTGETITHRWVQDDVELFSMDFTPGGPRWRVWTTKSITPYMSGDVEVQIIDESGSIIHSDMIVISD